MARDSSSMSTRDAAIRGAVAGAIGTLAMVALRRVLEPQLVPSSIRHKKHPPEQVTEWAASKTGKARALPKRKKMTAAMVLHFGYGSAAGALYGVARERLPHDDGIVSAVDEGATFGTAVWAASVEGLLPALGIAPPTTDLPKRKWPMPVLEHMAYGVVTALAFEALSRLPRSGSVLRARR
jgi:hypothetical protein